MKRAGNKPHRHRLARWLAREGLRPVRLLEQRNRAVLIVEPDPDRPADRQRWRSAQSHREASP